MRPLKNAQLKYPEVKRLGYKVSRSIWKNCSDRNFENKESKRLASHFQVLAEEEYFDEPVSLHHLHNKKNRISSALTKIKQLKSLTQESVSRN